MDDNEQLVLLTIDLRIPNFWENNLVDKFPDTSFIIKSGSPLFGKSFSGLLKIDNGNFFDIKKFLRDKHPKVNLDSFYVNSGIFFYEDSDSLLAKVTKGTNFIFNWPIKFREDSKRVKIILKRKFVDGLVESIEKKKVEIVNFSIINVDFGFDELLTPKQKEILDPCLKFGYYQFPKKISLNGLSEKIGISPSTLCVHLQKIESKILNSNYSELFFKNLNY